MRLAHAVAGALGGILLFAGGAPAAQGLTVEVIAIRAVEGGSCDPRLERFRPRLRKLAGFDGYERLSEEQRRVAWRATESFELPEGRSLILLPKGMQDDRVVMQVRLMDGRKRLVDTSIRLRNRDLMMFGLGRDARAADEAMLILLRAEH
jgi:hypothetical protein